MSSRATNTNIHVIRPGEHKTLPYDGERSSVLENNGRVDCSTRPGPFCSNVSLLRGGVLPGDRVPVDDVPDRLEVRRALVLVLQVVGVFPDIDAENRRTAAVHERAVLVRRADDCQLAILNDQPGPAGAKAAR